MQQNKHFQRAYATVLCATVNQAAKTCLRKRQLRYFECAAALNRLPTD
jgi:hypothetical protein